MVRSPLAPLLPFESFTYPFFDQQYTGDHQALVRALLGAENLTFPGDPHPGNKALYVHVPFCDTLCTFCPFVKSGNASADRVAAYLAALHTELRTVAATRRIGQWTLDAVYIGGGTPSVLTVEQIAELIGVIRDAFSIAADAEISFEFEAKSVDEAKFQALAELGVTRVSFGVQTFEPNTRGMVNLTASLDQVYAAIGWSTKYFTNTNLDIMVGFPGQDRDAALLDAQVAARCGIGSVSVYPVDYVMTLPGWMDQIRRGVLPRPAGMAERAAMFHAARAELMGVMGEQNMYCFGDPTAPPTKYMFGTLYGGYRDEAVGVGTGAYSVMRGLAYYNDADERTYVQRAGAGELPVAASMPYHAYEKGLVFWPKRLTFDLADLAVLSLEEALLPRIDALVAEGLAAVDGTVLRLTEPGKLVYSGLMGSFFTDPQQRLYHRMVARLDEQVGDVDNLDWVAGAAGRGRLGALNALPGAATTRRSLTVVPQ
ncbi:coproporphyrinogen-III oxidase family protein [Dactylosporangium sp. CA-152071]|uniref:coproporphyrinogen-III oxidase family protein n=1 Tax=Dactylosporangium sp. CA-152071 TaxID=3239933 RepID=UPI003D8F9950